MDFNKIEEKFEEVYKTKIEPNSKSMEVYRLKLLPKYKLCTKILIGLAVAIILEVIILWKHLLPNDDIVGLMLFINLISIVIVSTIQDKIANNFRKTIKPKLLQPLLSVFGALNIADKELISLKDIKALELYKRGHSKRDDDRIAGTYKELPIALVDTKITHSEKHGKKSTRVTDFQGLIVKVKMNKNFTGHTVARSKMCLDSLIQVAQTYIEKNPEQYPKEIQNNFNNFLNNPAFKTIGNTAKFINNNVSITPNGIKIRLGNNNNNNPKGLKPVLLEDAVFNDNYDVFSSDQVEARYLITPSFMERILKLQIIFMSPKIDFVFKNEYLYLFINAKSTVGLNSENGFFEVGNIDKTLINKTVYAQTFRELATIFSLVNHLKLDTRIGM